MPSVLPEIKNWMLNSDAPAVSFSDLMIFIYFLFFLSQNILFVVEIFSSNKFY